jgi:glyoxylase-like metal-dependent hydrolase (beta-lactamase superfamily II)
MKTWNDLKIFVDRRFLVNSYLIIKNNECLLIDPSLNDEPIKSYITEHHLKLVGIVLTHGHYDHIGNTFNLAKFYHVDVYLHHNEKPIVEKYHYGDAMQVKVNIDHNSIKYFDSSTLIIGNFAFDVLLARGHTPGGIILKYKNYVFSGDTIFYDSIGRTDLMLGNFNDMNQSLKLFLSHYNEDD